MCNKIFYFFIGMRAGLSPSIWVDEVLDQQLKLHLRKEYRNEAETVARLKLTGIIESMRKNMRWKATCEDYLKWFQLAEKSRWDKGYGLTKADAVAQFFTGHGTSPIRINSPTEFIAKRTTRYYPQPGSSAGRIITKQTGARRVQKDFESLMRTIFSLQDAFDKGKRAKMPKVNISRYVSKD